MKKDLVFFSKKKTKISFFVEPIPDSPDNQLCFILSYFKIKKKKKKKKKKIIYL